MEHLFIIDPLETFSVSADTTIAFMREVAARGHRISSCELNELHAAPEGQPRAWSTETEIRIPAGGEDVAIPDPWYATGERRLRPLADFDVIWMRKDPPYDLNYFFATHLLSLAFRDSLVVNDPRGLREVTEKLFVLRYPKLTPPTLVSPRIDDLLAFREELGGEMVIKPVDGCGGEGVFHLMPGDRNAKALLELVTEHGTRAQIAQRYIPEVRQGDKRIILIDGDPVGAVLRVPALEEARANFHVGGSAAKTEITARDREICTELKPALLDRGILFSGIDVIGNWLTEVNVTSPTGVREINALDGVCLEALVVDAVERRLKR